MATAQTPLLPRGFRRTPAPRLQAACHRAFISDSDYRNADRVEELTAEQALEVARTINEESGRRPGDRVGGRALPPAANARVRQGGHLRLAAGRRGRAV